MTFSVIINNLIMAFRCLPGVGPKTAQRMALHILERDKEGGSNLASTLQTALTSIVRCKQCRTLSDASLCNICSNSSRDRQLLCVVESPVDVISIEQTGDYKGIYFVLLGRLSPIDGIGPMDLGVNDFQALLDQEDIKEVIMATNPTVEGETTAYYFAEITKARGIATTRIAHGVPLGSELENIDGGTLARAMGSRSIMT